MAGNPPRPVEYTPAGAVYRVQDPTLKENAPEALRMDKFGRLLTNEAGSLNTRTAFGEGLAAEPTPVLQIGFHYNIVLRLRKNAELFGAPAFNDVDANGNATEFDIVSNSISGGELLLTTGLDKTGNDRINLIGEVVELEPGETVTATLQIPSGTTVANFGLNWAERQ